MDEQRALQIRQALGADVERQVEAPAAHRLAGAERVGQQPRRPRARGGAVAAPAAAARDEREQGHDGEDEAGGELHGARARDASIGAVRRPPVALLATVLALLLAPVAAHAQAPRTVPSELDALLAAGAIDQLHHDAWAESYDNAKATLKKLHGTRRRQLDAVIANTRTIAKTGLLTPSRAPLVFLTLQRNRAWWSEGSLLRYGQRVMFAGSQLVWQYYPGQGIQVQWLGTFGRANGLFQQTGRDDELRALLDEALALATARAGGIAWESLFHFDHGAPPWVSGLSQGTALQALSRSASRLGEPRYFEAARAALGIFRTPPPEGVRVDTPVGAHYLQYSFAPDLHIINGFIQALNGLFDFASFANDAERARALRRRGGAGARRAADLRHRRLVAVPARPGGATSATTCSYATSCASCASACPIRRSTAPRPTGSPPTCASLPCSP